MRLQIVTRGSRREGLGHLLRTRTFARAAAAGHDVSVVAVVDRELETVLGGLDCPVHFVRRDRGVTRLVEGFRPDVLVCDLTRLQLDVHRAIRREARLTVSLSPVFEHMSAVDAFFTRSDRGVAPDGVRMFGGLQFAVFSDQCALIEESTYERALAQAALPVAVCMGGADAANKTLTVVRALVAMDMPSALWVLLGEGYSHSYNALVETVRGDRRHEVILAKTNRSMWRVMGNCALAILAGGLTSVEALYAGLPSINLFEQPAHGEMMEELFAAGVCLNGGLFAEESLRTLTETLRNLNADRDRLRSMRQRGQGLVDDRGSGRVLAVLAELLAERTGANLAPVEGDRVLLPC